MQNTLQLTHTDLPIHKILTITLSAGLVTFGIFAGMQQLIKNEQQPNVKPMPTPIINLVFDYKEPPIIERTQLKPQPEPKPVPQPVNKKVDLDPDPQFIVPGSLGSFSPPRVTNPTINPYSTSSTEARPIVRIEPKYPLDAARDGVEGWVRLSFSITANGSVDNISVLEAEPKRIFDRAAKKALSKWKYKPNMLKGQASTQDGLMVMLEFKLSD